MTRLLGSRTVIRKNASLLRGKVNNGLLPQSFVMHASSAFGNAQAISEGSGAKCHQAVGDVAICDQAIGDVAIGDAGMKPRHSERIESDGFFT